ncbi:MAG: hypothetical protein PHP50_03815 [Lachnospiraceae bacterium]|nr:hypothetical protein [Lachnospiraceae bacterium]
MTEKRLPGVYPSRKKDQTLYYRASITFRRKHISLGSFSSMKAAHNAYIEAASLLENNEKTLLDYTVKSSLNFSKWVILLNFRDNGIYIGNPIYIRQKFFYYYLSQNHRLTFDIDDLFYYSSHKIMRRGGHLFVADYGSQISLHSRYGIPPFAVYDKDFRFRNGDNMDYRYENIEVMNPYHGVRITEHNGKSCYLTVIHIHGDYIVGRYHTALEAAIAYNKAIDCLNKKGLKKNFRPNYLENCSPSQYADIYSHVIISDRILNYSL